MNFRTNIQLQKERNLIDYNSKIVLIGSCFSENISNKLRYFKFNTFSNPFGILYNPKAIENVITNAINQKIYTEKDIFQLNERWHCFEAHSDLSNTNKTVLLNNLNTAINLTNKQLKNSTHLIITLGTAWVHRFIETDTFVGNCHKVPQKKFLKELLSVKKVIESLENLIELIKSINPTINIIFTVSPVRHLKDGFVENTQSKAHLISAIHQVKDKRNQVYYFPSYEIMMDDLRDYRFYNNDMVHPNETAVTYIWEQFQHVWLNENTTSIMKEVDTIQKGLAHKPFNPNSEQHQLFLANLHQKITVLEKQFGIHF
ncbi:GSCFA domain-containing protein [Lutibacter sp. B1]|uniref:GSCFA domain-containing protein n=1 Tax=Lutibacter sp. B1 TaxID=2725996 RepID=UPI0014567B90|nr:GSCFA domain-containing protein [Lutibacter sp. B1]NLP58528.1 GSCFA domain-containing protein [Lutibacter sp. B1]